MKYRVFAALELPAEQRQRLAETQNRLSAAVPGANLRWADADGIHLTLKFYGALETERLPAVQAGLARAAAAAGPLQATIQGLGFFPNPQRPQVIWAGLAGNLSGLQALQASVEAEAGALGFKPEERGYTPHLTLGRVNGRIPPAEHRALIDYVAREGLATIGEIRAEHVTLMRSQLRAGGSVYTPLFIAALGRPATGAGSTGQHEEMTPGND